MRVRVALTVGLILLGGCDFDAVGVPKDVLVDLTGTITQAGQPLPGALVTFSCAECRAKSTTDAHGAYRLTEKIPPFHARGSCWDLRILVYHPVSGARPSPKVGYCKGGKGVVNYDFPVTPLGVPPTT
jgi:hypothetical protein